MRVIYWSAPHTQASGRAGVAQDKTVALETLKVILGYKFNPSVEKEYSPLYRGHLYKIGITGNPQVRAYGHGEVPVDEKDNKNGTRWVLFVEGLWDRMHVILQTQSGPAIRQAERDFIKFATEDYGSISAYEQKPGQQLLTFNEDPGGGGPLPREGPFFLYVLQSKA